jgi:hypothetical protein
MAWPDVAVIALVLAFFAFLAWCVSRPVRIETHDPMWKTQTTVIDADLLNKAWSRVDEAFEKVDEAFKEVDQCFKTAFKKK